MVCGSALIDVAGSQLCTAREKELERFREKLTVEASFRAKHNEMKSRFLRGTRTGILDDLETWAKDTATTPQYPFYVLSGAAGTGKSTIAYEFASRLERCNLLGATFFFLHGDEQLSTPHFVVPTLAYQLSRNHPDLFPGIVESARNHLNQAQLQNFDSQLEDLIIAPLKNIQTPHSPVTIILDAVDECTPSMQAQVTRLLHLLKGKICSLSFPLRILVTSRPELHIENALNSNGFRDVSKVFKLHNIPHSVVDADISLYLRDQLSQFLYNRELMWKRPKAIEHLTSRAEGLFIYASIALDFLMRDADGPDFAVKRLDTLLSNPSGSESFRSQLDSLYLAVLIGAFPARILEDRDLNYRDRLQDVLGAVALAQDHISPQTLQDLLGIAASDVMRILARLKSLIISAEDVSLPMRPLHASFPQFLIDDTRCTNTTFLVDSLTYHGRLALHCLQALMKPGALPNVSSPHLRYGCVHWPTHLASMGGPSQELLELFDHFLKTYLLMWFEALSHIHRVETAAPALLRLHAWYQVSHNSQRSIHHILTNCALRLRLARMKQISKH